MKYFWIGVLLVQAVVGCNREAPTLNEFKERWEQTIRSQDYEQLYKMLDLHSRQKIRHDLEVIRGLDEALQKSALVQLGHPKLPNLRRTAAPQYFAMLWRQATGGKQPVVNVAAGHQGSADMVLAFEGNKRLHLQLVFEGGDWAWRLPQQSIKPVPNHTHQD